MKNRLTGDDYLDFFVSAMVAFFSIPIGGAWFIGLLQEPDKSELFLIMVSLGCLFCGIACAINCFYFLTQKIYKFVYYTGLVLVFIGYVLAVIGATIYENS